MENKINVAELLKDCPKGMELDCTIWDNVTLVSVDNGDTTFPIKLSKKKNGSESHFLTTKYGQYCSDSKCVIFPKGKTTWEGFQRPFKRDIKSGKYYLCIRNLFDELDNIIFHKGDTYYSPEDGKLIPSNSNIPYEVCCVDEYFRPRETKTLIEPKFKVGDRIRHKTANKDNIYEISKVYDDSYGLVDFTCMLDMKYQDNYELVPNKFDITTLVPFESKVLIRDHKSQKWRPAIWGVYDPEPYFPYKLIGCISHCCIPYEGNEHLLNTTDDCDEYYKNWE